MAVFAAPIVASYLVFNFWRPASTVNYGALLPPAPFPEAALQTVDGKAFQLAALKGKWVLLYASSGSCDQYCQTMLYDMRQVRLAQGKEQGRIERVWLIDDGAQPAAVIAGEHKGLWMVHAQGSSLLSHLAPAAGSRDHIYIVDPQGNLMMRYPKDPDPRQMSKDLQRLLKVSQVG
jgi:cytochrome oxidase Cu insertion factor (SCO1/SenC/PrrC family)